MVLIQMIRVYDKFSEHESITVAVDNEGMINNEEKPYTCTVSIDGGDEIQGKLEARKGGIAFSFNDLLLFKSPEGMLRVVKVKVFDRIYVKYFRGDYAAITEDDSENNGDAPGED